MAPPSIRKPPVKSPTTGPIAVTLLLCIEIGGPEGVGEAVGTGDVVGAGVGLALGAELGVELGEGDDVTGDVDVVTDVAVIDVAHEPLPVACAYKPRAGAGPLICAPEV